MNQLLSSGIELMFIGMGIVFAFLALLIVMVNIMTASLQKFFPETTLPESTPTTASTTHTDTDVIAAISAAVHQYRKDTDSQGQ